MKQQPSYEDLQKRILKLESELREIKCSSINSNNPSDNIFVKICEYSKNGVAIFETPDRGKSFFIKYFNRKALDLEKVEHQNIIGKNIVDAFPTISTSGFLESLKQVYNTGLPQEFPYIQFSSNKITEWKQNYIYRLSENEIVTIYIDLTEEKIKDSNLKEHQDKLQLAMQAANYYPFQIDLPSGKITSEEKLYDSLGYSAYEITNLLQKSGSLIHPDDYQKSAAILRAKQTSSESYFNNEIRIKNKQGNWIWYNLSGKIVNFQQDDKNQKVLGLIRNIQEEKENKIRLQESENQLKLAMESANQALIDWDIQKDSIYFSPEWFSMLGYQPDEQEINYDFTVQISHPEDVSIAEKKLADHIKGESPIFISEVRMKSKSGMWKWILTHGKIVERDNTGKPLRAIGIQTDITSIKATEQKLRESETNFRQLAENINDAFWLRTTDHKVVYANPACYDIIGENFLEIFENNSRYEEWIHPQDRNFILKRRAQNQLNPTKNHYYEHRILTKEGNVKWLWIRTFPVFNENGELYRRAGIASDITQHKNLISEMLKAKEAAEESDLLKSTFLANMSHEIRTPMNGILGFAELLKDQDLSPEEKIEYIKIIDSNGKQLLRLINDIIDISKIELNQLSIHKTVFNLNTIIHNIHIHFVQEQTRIRNQNIKLEIQIPTNINNIINTDESRLVQILANLISNAVKFTEKGTVTIGFKKIKIDTIDYYKFHVTDTGIGIPESMTSLIFERFGQVQAQKFKNEHGTGLGLAISKGLVELLGGNIWFESTPNIGSSFYFTIPARNNVKKENNLIKNQQKMEKWDDLEILIVEDDADNLEFLRRILLKQGAKVFLAKTGKEAINIVTHNDSIKIVLMDIRLPDIDGFETTQKIKAIKPNLPVIAQTAYAMYNDREMCLENGCDDYISKPLDKRVLYQKINSYIYN